MWEPMVTDASETMGSITGVGLITPLGLDASSTFAALLDDRYITNLGQIETIRTPPTVPRVSTLAMAAALEATAQAGWDKQTLSDPQTALIVGTSKGPIDGWIAALPHMSSAPYVSAGRPHEGLARISGDLATGLGLGIGPRLTVSAACASGLHALVRAVLLLRTGECRRALVVAAESSLHELFTASFERLGVLARDDRGCRPFDQSRAGFVISEAAAAVCVEAEPNRTVLAQIDGFALGTDAQHLTAGDPTGKTLRYLLGRVTDGRSVDLVHAHGTGTVLNDPIELAAIDDSVADANTCVYSHKGGLGHSLGASGMVSIVLTCLMQQQGIILPNVQTPRPLETTHVQLSQRAVERRINRSIVLASGFGGAAGVVSLISE